MSTSTDLPPIFLQPVQTPGALLKPKPLQDVPEHIEALLSRLHAESLAQEQALEGKGPADFPGQTFAQLMADKFIALEEDKCHFMYQVCRAINAQTLVEVGTSYGVSTIYLALAAVANASNTGGGHPRVIGTEHERNKAEQARAYWAECGKDINDAIDLREGDLRETLADMSDVAHVDFVLLDIWTPMALPALKLVQPKLKPGAVIITDNTRAAAENYTDLFQHLRAPDSPFVNSTLPFKGGLEFSVYLPKQ